MDLDLNLDGSGSGRAQVEVVPCSIEQPAQVRRFVQKHAEVLAGFVHSAGVLEDGLLPNQTTERFEYVLQPKAHAALYLHQIAEECGIDLQLFWVFSSVTSLMGHLGQTNYGAANAVLDALVTHRRARGQVRLLATPLAKRGAVPIPTYLTIPCLS